MSVKGRKDVIGSFGQFCKEQEMLKRRQAPAAVCQSTQWKDG